MSIPPHFLTQEHIDKTKKRILSKIDIAPKGCWVWQGSKESPKKNGRQRYGMMEFGGKKRLAHRVSKALFHSFHALFTDRDILCCHTCDNPLCINPDHIFLGTHDDNNKDKQSKGRAKKYRISCPHCHEDI